MRIAVNAQTLVKDKLQGLGYFTFEAMQRIVKDHPEHEFTFIFGKGLSDEFVFADNVNAINIGPPFFRPLTWLLKFEFLLPRFVNRGKYDLFLSPDGWSSPRIKCKTVIVIHDINFVHYPQFLPKSFYLYYKRYFPKWIRHAARIATVSTYSKRDIATTYSVDGNKIDVVYNGSSTIYSPISDQEKTQVKNKFTLGKNYFIFVGALHPRKNIINLLKAFDEFKTTDQNDIKFLIVGEKFYWDKTTNSTYENMAFKNDVIFAGRLSQEELRASYGAAIALLYVSLFEGFGIPIVEAMNCGIPIITSNTTSMPEVAGDAALIVDPLDVTAIADAMTEINNDKDLRNKMIEAGHKRKAEFSWDNTAKRLWETIEKVLQTK